MFLNTTGNGNVANGAEVLYSNTTGSYNAATGHASLNSNTTGSYNTAMGGGSLFASTTGSYNTGTGGGSLYANSTGDYNTASGFRSLYLNTTGSYNTANGNSALRNNSTGSNNVAMGDSSFTTNITGSNNTAIGSFSDVSKENLINATAIGFKAKVDAKNKVRIGNNAVTSIGGQVGWTNFSDARIKKNIKENVPGLAFINLLRPVTYNFNADKENELMGIKENAQSPGNTNIEKINFTGFLAQEVDKAAQKINYAFSGVDKSGDVMGLRYSEFVVPLVKAVQELSKMNNQLKKQNELQQQEIDELKAMIISSRSSVNSKQSVILTSASLEQNVPNPFTNFTTIHYTLPHTYSSAKIIITDKTGKILKEVNISGSGNGNLKVDAALFTNGAYQYSLYVNNKLIDTKQMALVK